MKKSNLIYIFILALTSINCSSDDDSSSSSTSANFINPPDWIQGVWLQQNGNSTTQSGYEFKSNDFILVLPTANNSFKENLELAENGGANTNVNEIISENEYKIEITTYTVTNKYYFEKKTDNIIEWTNDPLGELSETLYIKQ